MLAYATRAIFTINHVFSQWSTVSVHSLNVVTGVLEDLFNETAPKHQPTFSVSSIAAAAIAGVPYLSSPYGVSSDSANFNAGQALQTSLMQAPGVGSALWPAATTGSQTTSSNNIAALSRNSVESQIAAAARLLMTDPHIFVSFAESGVWVDNGSLSLEADEALVSALYTYMISSILSVNGYVAQVNTNTSSLAKGALAQAHSWTDPLTGLIYTMGSTSKASSTFFKAVLNQNSTTLAGLFAAPYACAQAGLFDGGMVVNRNATQSPDFSCVGRLSECKGDASADPKTRLQSCPGGWKALS